MIRDHIKTPFLFLVGVMIWSRTVSPTQNTLARVKQLLDYAASQEEAIHTTMRAKWHLPYTVKQDI